MTQSPDFQMVDYAYSEIMLGAGHIYRVRFTDETRNPRIVEAVEIERDSTAGRYIAISCGQRDPVDSENATSPSPNKEIEPRFVNGDRVLKEHKIGFVRSMVATSDGTFVYKVLWDGDDFPTTSCRRRLSHLPRRTATQADEGKAECGGTTATTSGAYWDRSGEIRLGD